MYVTVRLNGSLGRRLRVERGVRQGSITSPWMFNLVYQELVQRVNEMNCGISIGDKHFNIIFCYADDIHLASTTITELQVMIDVCTDYVEARTWTKLQCVQNQLDHQRKATLHLRSNINAEWDHLDKGKYDKIPWGDSRK